MDHAKQSLSVSDSVYSVSRSSRAETTDMLKHMESKLEICCGIVDPRVPLHDNCFKNNG